MIVQNKLSISLALCGINDVTLLVGIKNSL